jgi:transposase
MKLNKNLIKTFKKISRNLSGAEKRSFAAEITRTFLEGNARKAELIFGWNRNSVLLGLKELINGIICYIDIHERGNKPIEKKMKNLERDIKELIEPETQVDPQFKSDLKYVRITAKKIRKLLIRLKGYSSKELPKQRAINNLLNRMGYTLKRVQKIKPLKKIKETDAIFDNLKKINEEADLCPETLRISIDTKAKVNLGDFSRGGKKRSFVAPKAGDHDMNPSGKLVPFGILEVKAGQLFTIVGCSAETSDFIVDSLQLWWDERKVNYTSVKKLVINLDNGPSASSHRTQFIKRITEFATKNKIEIRLAYYPPYHSKYNPVERCWGVLENYWNGDILDSVEKTLGMIKEMTWKGIKPIVHFLDKVFEKGIKLTKKEMKEYEKKIKRSKTLPKWDVVIENGALVL